ncbi:MAG: phosphate/phosphite/phosphonate ABC transporter substrate-binding protein [Candidatus Thiodiazotropha sp. (ex Dulcina madagascariensis)]|nr:phosphate/phosphite/phosphonate ABC transporter substrate-binding protein [Candidatus Thiodiazotropha sp. (ex Epidulcina cf. delphinae)]MCU7933251.1 phosphate/phosphite/phosphonate ABC transporter substrate-binding protein [Candidatus Thiodiazotropha sp. (ex Dulcina madagascariensis)]
MNNRLLSKGMLVLLILGCCFPAVQTYASSKDPDTLVIGKISHNPKKHYRYLKPMVKYAVERMQDLGIRKGKIRMVRSKEQLADMVRRGDVDWVTETPIAAAYLHEKSGAEILVRKWKKGVPEYHSVFFSLEKSNINKLEDLVGKVIALEDPASTSAFYLPVYAMLEKGLRLIKLRNIREKPPADMVGFVFAREEINIATLVHMGIVDAGAFSNTDWNKEDHLPSKYRAKLSIFMRTSPIIRAVEMVRQDIDPAIRKRLEEILLQAGNDPQAAPVLHAYQRTKKFDKLSRDQETMIYNLRQIMDVVDPVL